MSASYDVIVLGSGPGAMLQRSLFSIGLEDRNC